MRYKFELSKFKNKIGEIKSEKTRDFVINNWFTDQSKVPRQEDIKKIEEYRSSSTIKIKIKFPYKKMLKEAQALKESFVPHRQDPSYGWESLCIHGMSDTHTDNYSEYGHETRPVDKFTWTEASKKCPITTNWFKQSFPYSQYFRLRFMKLKPFAYITPHNDLGGDRGFAAINISLNQPYGCMMFMEGFGLVPWAPGQVRLMDIGINHSVINLSGEDRYHIIVHGYADGQQKERYNKMLLNSLKE